MKCTVETFIFIPVKECAKHFIASESYNAHQSAYDQIIFHSF